MSHDLVYQAALLMTSVNIQRDAAASSIAVWAEKLIAPGAIPLSIFGGAPENLRRENVRSVN
jgi:hypothetical protein